MIKNSRLYVQLKPDDVSLQYILQVIKHYEDAGRAVKENKIHLTIIHFGIVSEILDSLPAEKLQKLEAFAEYVSSTQDILETYKNTLFKLTPAGLDLYGEYKTTLVIKYEPTDELLRLHKQCLEALQVFLKQCGVEDVGGWMKQDHNFKHALSMHPHITLIKNFSGKLDEVAVEPVKLNAMQLLY